MKKAALLSALLLFPLAAFNQTTTGTSKQTSWPEIIPLPAQAAIFGFEASAGYVPGSIAGQNGWSTFDNNSQQVISTANPFSGNQHLRLQFDGSLPPGTLLGAFSPNLGPLPATLFCRVSVEVFISANGNTDYQLVANAPSRGVGIWRVQLHNSGSIQVYNNIGGNRLFVDTGASWPIQSYFNITVEANNAQNTIDYYLNGQWIYATAADIFPGGPACVEQMLLAYKQQPGQTADFDDLVIENDLIFRNGLQ